MASTRTAIAPMTPNSKGGSIQKKAATPTTPTVAPEGNAGARPPVKGIFQAHGDFVSFLYETHGATYDDNITKLEQATGAKREHFTYGIGALLAFYLIAGNSAQFICNLIGFAYPAYVSVKAVRTVDKNDDTQWLIYWTVFAFFSLIDFFFMGIVSWMNIYWLVKALFLVYLYLPQTMGAQTLYKNVVDPVVKKIDAFLEKKEI